MGQSFNRTTMTVNLRLAHVRQRPPWRQASTIGACHVKVTIVEHHLVQQTLLVLGLLMMPQQAAKAPTNIHHASLILDLATPTTRAHICDVHDNRDAHVVFHSLVPQTTHCMPASTVHILDNVQPWTINPHQLERHLLLWRHNATDHGVGHLRLVAVVHLQSSCVRNQ